MTSENSAQNVRPRFMVVRNILAALVLGLAGLPTPGAAQAPVAASQVLVMLRSPPQHARVDASYGGAGYGDGAREHAQAMIAARIAAAHGFTIITQWPMPSIGVDCIAMSLPPGVRLADGIAMLQTHGDVAWAQALNEFQAQGHTDPLYSMQPAATQWHLDELHTVATGRRVRVAVIDSGVDVSHPDLAGAVEAHRNFVSGQSYVAERHGTAVAGLIAARADNGIGIVGIAPDVHLLTLRACWEVNAQSTLCNSLSLAEALNFSIEERADVINMSLSGPNDRLIGRLIDVALARHQQVVAAVDVAAADGGFPAAHPGVIAVAGSPFPGRPGALVAPALDLPATLPGGRWGMVTGSSFAAAQVSGLVAVLDQADADRVATLGAAEEPKFKLVRAPDDTIDVLASLMRIAPDFKNRISRGPHIVAANTAVRPP